MVEQAWPELEPGLYTTTNQSRESTINSGLQSRENRGLPEQRPEGRSNPWQATLQAAGWWRASFQQYHKDRVADVSIYIHIYIYIYIYGEQLGGPVSPPPSPAHGHKFTSPSFLPPFWRIFAIFSLNLPRIFWLKLSEIYI